MDGLIRAEQVTIFRPRGTEVERHSATKGVSVRTSTTYRELERLAPEWLDLYAESQTRNPFANPGWQRAWRQHFTREDELSVIEVRLSGRLVGVAPFYRRRSVGGLQRVRLIGMGRDRT